MVLVYQLWMAAGRGSASCGDAGFHWDELCGRRDLVRLSWQRYRSSSSSRSGILHSAVGLPLVPYRLHRRRSLIAHPTSLMPRCKLGNISAEIDSLAYFESLPRKYTVETKQYWNRVRNVRLKCNRAGNLLYWIFAAKFGRYISQQLPFRDLDTHNLILV